MLSNRIIQAASLLFISIVSAKAQLWIGNDNFNSTTLDTSKWTVWKGPNFVKTPTTASFVSTTILGTVGDGIYWNQSLPTNQNWVVTVEASISPSFNTSSSASFVMAGLTISSDVVNLNSLFTNCLGRGDNIFGIVPNWSANGAPNQDISTTIDLNNVVLKMNYNASSKMMTSSYADISTPTNFLITKSLDVSNWLNMEGGFRVLVGGYSNDASIGAGLLNMDNFVVTPEPSALSLLAVGLGGLAIMRRRRS